MKKIFKTLIVLALSIFLYSCDKSENDNNEIDNLTEISDFDFKINSDETYEDELSLFINQNNNSIDFVSSKLNSEIEVSGINLINENNEKFIIQTNSTKDTLTIHSRDIEGTIQEQGLRYIVTDYDIDILEFINIDIENKTISVENRFELFKKVSSNKTNKTNLMSKGIDELENEITKTGNFLSDPSNLHPVSNFFKGIVQGISDGSSSIYENSSNKLNSIKNSLNNKRTNLLNNLSKINKILNDAKSYLADNSKNLIENTLKEYTEEEIDSFDLEELEDLDNLDCNNVINGSAYLDGCNECVYGNTGKIECEEDCNGVFGGSAFYDNCGDCVGGNTGFEQCVQDCNGDYGGIAFYDNCGDCVFGNTGKLECEKDCSGVYGGSAYLDDCGQCIGENTNNEDCGSQILFENAVVGDWLVTSIGSGNVRNLTLYDGGYGRYIISGSGGANKDGIDENGDSYYSVSWKIEKSDGKYHLREDGFWNFGYDQYRTLDTSLQNNFLTNPISFFETYQNFGVGASDALRYTKN